MNKKILLLYLSFALLMIGVATTNYLREDEPLKAASTRTLTKSQQANADYIGNYVIEHYDEYQVLPSIAVAQAFVESTLGDHCSDYNLWGIRSGAEHYGSLEEACIRYLNVINNGRYDGALGNKSYESSIQHIINGGYCVGNPNYVSNVVWSIEAYGFDKYDKKLDKILEKKKKEVAKEKREKKCEDGEFIIEYSEDIPYHAIGISKKFSHKKGTIMVEYDNTIISFKDAEPISGIGDERILYSSDPELVGMIVKIHSDEDSVG